MQLDAKWSLDTYALMHTWAVMEFPIQKIKSTGNNHVLSKIG